MELKVTKERVLEAVGKCKDAKATLEALFPEAFKEEFTPGDRVIATYSGALEYIYLGTGEEARALAKKHGESPDPFPAIDGTRVYLLRGGRGFYNTSLKGWKVVK